MNIRFLRLLFASILALALLPALPLSACAEDLQTQTGQAELFIDGKFPEPSPVMAVSFDQSGFNTLVYDALSSQQAEIDVSEFLLTPGAFNAAYSDLINANPELFYVSSAYSYCTSGGLVTQFFPIYRYSGADLTARIAAYNASVSRIASYANRASTRVGKLLLANMYFCMNFEYDTTYSIYSPDLLFSQGRGVCQAYMLGFSAVLDALGIPNTPAVSDAMNHIWNMVQVDGDWYHIDVTWNDPTGSKPLNVHYDNFLLSQSGITAENHYSWSAQVTASNTKYDDYFWRCMTMPLSMQGSTVYYVDPNTQEPTRTVMAHDLSGGSSSALFSYNIGYSGGGGFEPVWVSGDRVYFTSGNTLCSGNFSGGDLCVEYVIPSDGELIWRLYMENGVLMMFIASGPYEDGSVVSLTDQDILFTFDASQLVLTPGQGAQLTAKLNGSTDFFLPMTWSVSNANAASADAEGRVDALAAGYAEVTASIGDSLTASCGVYVRGSDVFTLPQEVSAVEAGAFENVAAQEIVLPEGVTSLGAGAFSGCEQLGLIHLPASLQAIDPAAFDGCGYAALICPADSAAERFALEQGLPFAAPPAAE